MRAFLKVAVFSLICGCAFGVNLVELAEKLGANILLNLLKEADLETTIATGGNFTVFAPTDKAFDALPPDVKDKLKSNPTLLKEVLLFHVIKGKVFSKSLSDELVVPTLNKNADIRINIYEDKKIVTATGSVIAKFDQEASNGVIHVIERVMFPLPTDNLVSTAIQAKAFNILVNTVKVANLDKTLSGKGPFTLFAPTDAAFEALPHGALAMLLKNATALAEVLKYHVVSGTDYSAGLRNGLEIKTVEGKDVEVKIDGGKVMVNQANVVKVDISTNNGVIHVIDSVLLPTKDFFRKRPKVNMNLVQLAESLGANTLVKLLKTAGLDNTIATGGPFTVFAPKDEAFSPDVVQKLENNIPLLKEVLTFHVIQGKVLKNDLSNELVVPTLNKKANIRINIYDKKVYTATGSVIAEVDKMASNGVIHVIEKVMFPLPTENLVSTAIQSNDLKILVQAVKLADLVETLSEKGPFTLFAPTDAAFEALPHGALAMLLKNKTALAEVLKYHVVPGTDYSAGLTNGLEIKTVEGKDVEVKIECSKVMVNQANVVKADIPVANGVVHVIDSVLLPSKDFFQKRPKMSFWLAESARKMYDRRF